jgi:hypothetical protein
MPLFGSGCHRPDQEPDSAPPGTIYWIENVLISLVPNTVFENHAEAAIAKAVEYGLGEGKIHFQVVVFSILNAIMLEADVRDGVTVVRRTEVVPILKFIGWDHGNDDGNNNDHETHTTGPLEQLCCRHQGFVSLQNFFKVAANRRFSVFSQGRFPTEIYAMIIAYADSLTRNACAKVSRICHELCQGHFLTIVKFEAYPDPTRLQNRKRRSWLPLDDVGIFSFQDQNTGLIMRSRLQVLHQAPLTLPDEEGIKAWCPVVGTAARLSMMAAVKLRVLLPQNY